MKHYGLIGKHLGHSWSADYFTRKFAAEGIDADYRLIELDALWEGVPDNLDGYNVTIPYKQAIIPYLNSLDPIAAEIGAVNVVKDGVGYNTDWIGALKAINDTFVNVPIANSTKKALILGQGGAAKAVRYAVKSLGMDSEMISARGRIVSDLSEYVLIVNATPLGMYPDITSCPDLRYDTLTPHQVLFDCVYNPEETEFLKRGKAHGAKTIGGFTMLIEQARASWEIWNQ